MRAPVENTVTDPRIQIPSVAQLAVLGSPIAHSQSPVIHAAAYGVLGLDWNYGRRELVAADLAEFLSSCDENWRGLSLTMPLKEEAHRLAEVLDPVAEESGVVNTMLRVTGVAGSAAWAGFNTDVGGLAAAIARQGFRADRTIVLGAGATAVSAVLAARRLGAREVTVCARRSEAAVALAERFDGSSEPGGAPLRVSAAALSAAESAQWESERAALSGSTLIISTLPSGSVDWSNVPAVGLAATFDVSYHPWPSELAKLTSAAGMPVAPGSDMLVEQAVLQIRVFVNGDPGFPLADEAAVLTAMRDAVPS